MSERTAQEILWAYSQRTGMPTSAHLQVADRCNHACAHCYQVQGMKGELSFADVCAVLRRLADAGVLMLSISGGEATLRSDLLDLLREARSLGFAVSLYTNAYNIDDELAQSLAEIGLREVHVSLYSARPAEHDAVTRVPGSHARTLAGVTALRERGVRVVLKTPFTSLAAEGRTEVAALAEGLGCSHRTGREITPREDGSIEPQRVAVDHRDLVRDGMIRPWVPSPADGALVQRKLAGQPCGVCQSGVVVLPDGTVQPCSDTILPLGSVATGSLQEILRSNESVALFRSITWDDVHGCRGCALLAGCSGRCHATALHTSGDYLGPYATACSAALAAYEAGHGSLRVLDLDGKEIAERGRDVIGPFVIDAPGVVRRVPDTLEPRDIAIRTRFPWVAPASTGAKGHGETQEAGNLVPIDRLRAKTARSDCATEPGR